MGNPKQIKFLKKTIEDLMAGLDRKHFSFQDVLGGVLMELYDTNRVFGSQDFQQIHEKVWAVMEAIRQRSDEPSKIAYETYLKVYRGICQELGLSEVLTYTPETEQGFPKSNKQVLRREFSSLISAIQEGELKPQDFLRQGLDELGDIISEDFFLETSFARASQLYANVLDFLGTSGVYRDVEDYRQKYKALLGKVNGNSQTKPKPKLSSAGIGRRALSPTKEPSFRKGLS